MPLLDNRRRDYQPLPIGHLFANEVDLSLGRFTLTLSGKSFVQRIIANHLQDASVECDFSRKKNEVEFLTDINTKGPVCGF